MKKTFLFVLILLFLKNLAIAKDEVSVVDNLFHIDQMNSHNENFALYFKTREKAILAIGDESNYINDYPKDLYIYDYKTKNSSPLISYDWFPTRAKYFLEEYNLDYIEDIDWNKSEYEKILDKGREIKKQSINHSFF